MQKLVANIKACLEAESREAYLLYINPMLSTIIEGANFLRKINEDPRYSVYKTIEHKSV